jgi:GTP:adenosylcobinamide-phosphate guanylyltransferase
VTWTAIVLAGSRPGTDPFAQSYGTDLKALIPVGGVPMVRRPVEALLASEEIGRIRVLAQQPERIATALPNDPRLSVEHSGATIASTVGSILAESSIGYPILVTTADHALLDPAMIADFCAKATGADLAIGLVERASLMARLPSTKRTWLKFRSGAYSGANIFAFGSPKAAKAVELWRTVEQDRKKGWRMIGVLGPTALLGAAFRLRTLDQSLTAIGHKLGLSIRKVELENPLAAVDVDKPADHQLVTAIIEGRA